MDKRICYMSGDVTLYNPHNNPILQMRKVGSGGSSNLVKVYVASVMVNFVCQLDWVTGCPDTGLNTVSGRLECAVDESSTGIGTRT